MSDFSLPFPGRELADQELTYDLCYDRIPPEARAPMVERAWQRGAEAARQVYAQQQGSTDFFAIATASGLRLVEKETDYVVGGQRYFSDYISGQSLVNLYMKSIDLWAAQNNMERRQAANLILSHEYYHFL